MAETAITACTKPWSVEVKMSHEMGQEDRTAVVGGLEEMGTELASDVAPTRQERGLHREINRYKELDKLPYDQQDAKAL